MEQNEIIEQLEEAVKDYIKMANERDDPFDTTSRKYMYAATSIAAEIKAIKERKGGL